MLAHRTLAAAVLLVLACSSERAVVARTWTASSGSFTVEAELVDFKNNTVYLKRDDNGKTIAVPVDKLSLGDLTYIRERMRQLQADLGSPPDVVPSTDSQGAGNTAGKAELVPDPLDTKYDPESIDSDTINIKLNVGLIDRTLLFPTQPSPFVVTGGYDEWRCYDLRTGQPAGQAIPSDVQFQSSASLSSDGRLLAVANSDDVYMLSFVDGSRRLLDSRQFVPPSGEKKGSLKSAQFITPTQLLVGGSHASFLYDLSTDKATHLPYPRSHDRYATTSPGGRYIAVADDSEGIDILDLRHEMKSVSRHEFSQRSRFNGMSFSPDGKEFAFITREGTAVVVTVLNMETESKKSWSMLSKEFLPRSKAGQGYNPWRDLQWFADGSGWLFQGKILIPRDPGQSAVPFSMETREPSMVRILDARRALVVVQVSADPADYSNLKVVCRDMPLESVSAIAKAVADGGTVADVLLPSMVERKDAADYADLGFLIPQNGYDYTPPAAPPIPQCVDSIPLRRGDDFEITNVWFGSSECARAVVEIIDTSKKFAQYPSPTCLGGVYFDTYDLSSGASLGQFDLTYPARLLSLSADGKLAAMLLTGVKGASRLDIWSLTDSEHVVGFQPFANSDRKTSAILSAAFVDNQSLLIQHVDGAVSLFRIPECETAYTLDVDAVAPVLSPDRSVMLLQSQNRLILANPLDGHALGTLAKPDIVAPLEITQALFSSDGRRLAVLSSPESEAAKLSYVCLWDLTSGLLTAQLPVPLDATSIAWAADGNLLVADKVGGTRRQIRVPGLGMRSIASTPAKDRVSLVDSAGGLVLWTYNFPDGGHIAPNSRHDRLYFARPGEGRATTTLVAAKLPDAKTTDALAHGNLGTLKPIVSPGATWKIQLDTKEVPAFLDPDQVHAELTKQLTSVLVRNGMRLKDSGADLTLDVKFEAVDTERRFSYRVLGGGIMRESVPDVLVRCHVRVLDLGGEAIWSRDQSIKTSTSGSFGLESVPRGEIVGEYLRKRPWKVVFGWLTEAGVPRYVFTEDADSGLGESELRSSGPVMVRSP